MGPAGRAAAAVILLAAPTAANAGEPLRSWVDANGVLHVVDRHADREVPGARIYTDADGAGFGGEPPLVIEVHGLPEAEVARGRFDGLFREAAAAYALPFAFLKAVARVESNFDPDAVSRADAKGLMQLIDSTAARMEVSDPFDPRQSVFGGARYLRILIDAFDGDMVKAVAAYNAGPDRVRRAGGVPPIRETQRYVRRVFEMYRRYRLAEEGR